MTVKEVVEILSAFPNQNDKFIFIDENGFVTTDRIMINEMDIKYVPEEIQEYRKKHPGKNIVCRDCGSTNIQFFYNGMLGNMYRCEDCCLLSTLEQLI